MYVVCSLLKNEEKYEQIQINHISFEMLILYLFKMFGFRRLN